VSSTFQLQKIWFSTKNLVFFFLFLLTSNRYSFFDENHQKTIFRLNPALLKIFRKRHPKISRLFSVIWQKCSNFASATVLDPSLARGDENVMLSMEALNSGSKVTGQKFLSTSQQNNKSIVEFRMPPEASQNLLESMWESASSRK